MQIKNILCSIFLIAIFSSQTFAQNTISLLEARELAIKNNKKLRISSEEERVAYYQKKEAFLKYLPQISAEGIYLHNQKNLYLLESNLLPSSIQLPLPSGDNIDIPIPGDINQQLHERGKLDIRNVWVGNISLTQPLFMGGKIIAYNDIMNNAYRIAQSKKKLQLQETIAEVDNAYWQVVALSEKRKIATSYLTLLKKMTSDITIMEEEGVVTKADVLSVMVKMNEADVALTKVDNGLNLSRMFLNQLCGLPIEEDTKLADEHQQLSVEEETSLAITLVEEALENRPEIESLQLASKIYKGKEKIARSEFLPQVGLTAGYMVTNPNGFDGFKNNFGGMWNIGVAVKVPLNFLTSSTKLNAAKAQTRMQEIQLEEAKEKIELQVNQSSFKLNEAYKKYKSTQKNMEKADENLRYANVGFEEGVIPPSDVLAAHSAWLSAHSELIDAQIDIKLCKVYLDKALGRNLNE